MLRRWGENPTPDKLFTLLLDNGWTYLSHGNNRASFYRWAPHPVREELHISFDAASRISGWTVWHNIRQNIDQDTGRRARLEAFITKQKEPS